MTDRRPSDAQKDRARRRGERLAHKFPERWRRASYDESSPAFDMWEIRCERCYLMACADAKGFGGNATVIRCIRA